MRWQMVELFSGVGNVSAAFKDAGYATCSFDKVAGNEMDFSKPSGFAYGSYSVSNSFFMGYVQVWFSSEVSTMDMHVCRTPAALQIKNLSDWIKICLCEPILLKSIDVEPQYHKGTYRKLKFIDLIKLAIASQGCNQNLGGVVIRFYLLPPPILTPASCIPLCAGPGALVLLAPECGPWGRVARGSTMRSCINPLGIPAPFVVESNMHISRPSVLVCLLYIVGHTGTTSYYLTSFATNYGFSCCIGTTAYYVTSCSCEL